MVVPMPDALPPFLFIAPMPASVGAARRNENGTSSMGVAEVHGNTNGALRWRGRGLSGGRLHGSMAVAATWMAVGCRGRGVLFKKK